MSNANSNQIKVKIISKPHLTIRTVVYTDADLYDEEENNLFLKLKAKTYNGKRLGKQKG